MLSKTAHWQILMPGCACRPWLLVDSWSDPALETAQSCSCLCRVISEVLVVMHTKTKPPCAWLPSRRNHSWGDVTEAMAHDCADFTHCAPLLQIWKEIRRYVNKRTSLWSLAPFMRCSGEQDRVSMCRRLAAQRQIRELPVRGVDRVLHQGARSPSSMELVPHTAQGAVTPIS